MERLINNDSTVTQLWNPITLRNPEDGGDIFFEMSVLTTAARYKVPEDIIIDTAMKASQKTVFFDHK
jgi:hypothetical protein